MHIYEPAEYLQQLALTKHHSAHTLKLSDFEKGYLKRNITPDLRIYKMTADQQEDLLAQIINSPPITDAEYEAELDFLIASSDDNTNILLNSMRDAHLNELKRQELQIAIDTHHALTIHYTTEIDRVKKLIKAFVDTGKIPSSCRSKFIKTPQQYGQFLCHLHRHLTLTRPLGAANFDQLIREAHGLIPKSPQLAHLHRQQPSDRTDPTSQQ